ncbi:MAG: tyrosine-type recombinase/integrase [Bacillota bacterium]|nr:tyrosine-type recombinase/integrase [Bacillota bacterium]
MTDKQSKLRSHLSEMPDFVFRFIDYYYDGESINTQLAFALDIKIFLNFLIEAKHFPVTRIEQFNESCMNEISVDDLLEYKSYLRMYTVNYKTVNGETYSRTHRNSNMGINRKMSSLRSLFSYLYKTDKISQNVTLKLDMNKITQKIKKPLTVQETIRLMDVILNGENYFTGRPLTEYLNRKQRDIALYVTYLGTGVRVSELVNLDIADIDFETSSFKVTRKGGDEDEIFMPIQVENELFTYLEARKKLEVKSPALFISRNGERLTISSVEHNLKTYCMMAGITNKDKTRPHALRRTFACTLLEEGVDIKMVAELMGHKNIEVTHKFYAQYSSAKKKEIMRSRALPEDIS